MTAEYYGMRLLEAAKESSADIVRRLELSDDPDERDLATHIARLESCVSDEAYGLAEAEAEQGVITSKGYITEEAEIQMIYRGSSAVDVLLTANDFIPKGMSEDLKGKVVAIRSDVFLPEYRSSKHQLYIATGGFGCAPDARGRTVFGISLYTGESERWARSDVLGVVSESAIPDWARERLAALRQPTERESVMDKIRQDRADKAAEPHSPKPKTHKKDEQER
jgi:hypothetical protein